MINNLKKLTISILLLTSLAVMSSCSNIAASNEIKYDDAHLYTAASQAEISGSISAIEIEWICGNIDIVASEQSLLSLSEYGNSLDSEHMMHYYVDGETLRIKCAKSGARAVNFPEKSLTVALPDGMSLDSLEIESISAPVKVDTVSVSHLELETVSGNFEAVSSVINKFEGESISGNVVLEGSFNQVDIDNVSGDVKINSSSCPREVNVESISGKVELYLPEDSGVTVDFDTASGIFDCELAFSEKMSRYVIGDGSAKFEIETVSGNVKIAKK